jgi:hypothetical protein
MSRSHARGFTEQVPELPEEQDPGKYLASQALNWCFQAKHYIMLLVKAKYEAAEESNDFTENSDMGEHRLEKIKIYKKHLKELYERHKNSRATEPPGDGKKKRKRTRKGKKPAASSDAGQRPRAHPPRATGPPQPRAAGPTGARRPGPGRNTGIRRPQPE